MGIKVYVDENGVPYIDYGLWKGLDIGRQHSVLYVAERGLWYLKTYQLITDPPHPLLSYNYKQWVINKSYTPKTKKQAQEMALSCANWLFNRIEKRESFFVWTYPYRFHYDTSPGWASAHTQAVGMQFLMRMAKLTGKSIFLDPIDGLLAAFSVRLEEGGLLDHTSDGYPWYEKIADPNNQKPRILNGLIFSCLGLWEIGDVLRKPAATHLFLQGLDTVRHMLPHYDDGAWSLYDSLGNRASEHYHVIHIQQMDRLYDLTKDPFWADWRDRFSAQLNDAHARNKKSSANNIQLKNLRAEQEKLKSQLRAVKNSFSYRLGTMLV